MRIFAILLTFVMSSSVVFSANVTRDYYSEPGLNSFKDTLNQNANEHIDPFSGHLSIQHTDLVVPGNGGLDIVINRIYNSLQDSNELGYITPTGVGWTMHYGRVIIPYVHRDKMCSQDTWNTTTLDNPSFELPDGGRQLLVFSNDQANAYLVTKNNWKAECRGAGESFGLEVISPNGTRYIMDQRHYRNYPGQQAELSYYASEIIDRNGNSLSINYTQEFGSIYITNISASDGRNVAFSYINKGTNTVRLSTITSNGQKWQYTYQDVPEAPYFGQLIKVTSPEADIAWNYNYYPLDSSFGAAGSFSLKQITYPTGGTINYEYGLVEFNQNDLTQKTTVVTKKIVSGRGDWIFEYVPAKVSQNSADVFDTTTITTPKGKYIYRHYGYTNIYVEGMWLVGLLFDKETHNLNKRNSLIQTETNEWASRVISDENYWHGGDPSKIDIFTYAPILTRRVIERAGNFYETVYNNYDVFGNPQIVIQGSKTTNYLYENNFSKWIIGQVTEEELVSIGKIIRRYDTNGNMEYEDQYGIKTYYTYTNSGDVSTITKGGIVPVLGETTGAFHRTTHKLYHRGIAQTTVSRVTDTKDITTTKVVNNTGTIQSTTNGRGKTTSFCMII